MRSLVDAVALNTACANDRVHIRRDRRRRKKSFVSEIAITAGSRSAFGKGASRQLRRTGQVPAVIYGEGQPPVHVAVPAHDLDLALREPRVVLAVAYEGKTILTKPRDVQRDPVRLSLEHIDLVVISAAEAKQRSAVAEAIHAAEEAAIEAGIDPHAAAAAVEEAMSHGESAEEAAAHALSDVQEKAQEYADANAAAAAVEQAQAAETSEA